MRNSVNNLSTIYGGLTPTIDIEDNSADLMVIQREDMTIHHTGKITARYVVEETFWITKVLGYNIKDEVIYIITEKPTRNTPDFIPEEVI